MRYQTAFVLAAMLTLLSLPAGAQVLIPGTTGSTTGGTVPLGVGGQFISPLGGIGLGGLSGLGITNTGVPVYAGPLQPGGSYVGPVTPGMYQLPGTTTLTPGTTQTFRNVYAGPTLPTNVGTTLDTSTAQQAAGATQQQTGTSLPTSTR